MIWKLLLFAQIVDCHILSKEIINAPIAILPSKKNKPQYSSVLQAIRAQESLFIILF
jgi:hypothetical protein